LSQVAETLYNRGFISYPRTETDSFVEGTDLNGLIAIHTADPNWGNYAQQYANQKPPLCFHTSVLRLNLTMPPQALEREVQNTKARQEQR
jgi:DNA topoisomerase IA